jgi:hypothetical protein
MERREEITLISGAVTATELTMGTKFEIPPVSGPLQISAFSQIQHSLPFEMPAEYPLNKCNKNVSMALPSWWDRGGGGALVTWASTAWSLYEGLLDNNKIYFYGAYL